MFVRHRYQRVDVALKRQQGRLCFSFTNSFFSTTLSELILISLINERNYCFPSFMYRSINIFSRVK